MSKKTICSAVRVIEMAITLIIMRKMYGIGVVGYLLIALTAIVWSAAAVVEDG